MSMDQSWQYLLAWPIVNSMLDGANPWLRHYKDELRYHPDSLRLHDVNHCQLIIAVRTMVNDKGLRDTVRGSKSWNYRL